MVIEEALSAEGAIKEAFTEQKMLEQDPRDLGLEFFRLAVQ